MAKIRGFREKHLFTAPENLPQDLQDLSLKQARIVQGFSYKYLGKKLFVCFSFKSGHILKQQYLLQNSNAKF